MTEGMEFDAYRDEIETLREARRADADQLATLTKALREIYKGSIPLGRWLDCSEQSGECDGLSDESIVPEGYEAVDEDERDDFQDVEGKFCWWCVYSDEDQAEWVESCARLSGKALETIGVALGDPADVAPAISDR